MPTWDASGDAPRSTDPPLSEAPFGAVEFSLWKEIGEEFLLTSSGETKQDTHLIFMIFATFVASHKIQNSEVSVHVSHIYVLHK